MFQYQNYHHQDYACDHSSFDANVVKICCNKIYFDFVGCYSHYEQSLFDVDTIQLYIYILKYKSKGMLK